MRTYKALLGMKVVSQAGSVVGVVKDLCIGQSNKIEALVVKGMHMYQRCSYLSLQEIVQVTDASIVIKNSSVLRKNRKRHKLTAGKLIGYPLFNEAGEQLGLLEDVYFHEKMGILLGYEITNGFFSDITEGHQMIYATDSPVISEDSLVINDYS